MNSFNGFANSIRNVGYSIINYIYNFPALDSSLVLYYPLDSSLNTTVANYASGLPVYDASLSVGTTITTSNDSFVSGLGDLSLNNTMGSVATQYVKSNKSFNLNRNAGLSISVWFSCSGELGKTGSLISLYQNSTYPSIELDIVGSTLFSQYYTPYTYSLPTTINALIGSTNLIPERLGNADGYHVYKFTSTGSIQFTSTPTKPITVILVGAGGSGGKYASLENVGAGGGGGGGVGYGDLTLSSPITLTITIGNGIDNDKGQNSSIIGGSISETAYGGGRGAGSTNVYANCGSGGGGCGNSTIDGGTAYKGSGTLTYYGNNGGASISGQSYYGGGGGGAGTIGVYKFGGEGISFNILKNKYFGGGGGGGSAYYSPNNFNPMTSVTDTTQKNGAGNYNQTFIRNESDTAYIFNPDASGRISGGHGGYQTNNGIPGVANTGGGGGGSSSNLNNLGGTGGSGICIIFVPQSGL